MRREYHEELDEVTYETRFFRYVHPHCPMLDPQLHTASFVRERSAYLMTVVLALGAVGIATSTRGTKRDLERASKLYAHAEKVHLVIYATSAKSTEIIQAQLVSQSSPK